MKVLINRQLDECLEDLQASEVVEYDWVVDRMCLLVGNSVEQYMPATFEALDFNRAAPGFISDPPDKYALNNYRLNGDYAEMSLSL